MLWVKANPSGLVTISIKMSMEFSMLVRMWSLPYSLTICKEGQSGNRGGGGEALLGRAGHLHSQWLQAGVASDHLVRPSCRTKALDFKQLKGRG